MIELIPSYVGSVFHFFLCSLPPLRGNRVSRYRHPNIEMSPNSAVSYCGTSAPPPPPASSAAPPPIPPASPMSISLLSTPTSAPAPPPSEPPPVQQQMAIKQHMEKSNSKSEKKKTGAWFHSSGDILKCIKSVSYMVQTITKNDRIIQETKWYGLRPAGHTI